MEEKSPEEEEKSFNYQRILNPLNACFVPFLLQIANVLKTKRFETNLAYGKNVWEEGYTVCITLP